MFGNIMDILKDRPRVPAKVGGPSLTRQEFKDECDLGRIMRRFAKTPDGARALQNAQGFAEGAQFGDVSSMHSFQEAMNTINAAKASFNALPSSLRRRFNNDPVYFLDFVQDPANLDECRKLGLAKPAGQALEFGEEMKPGNVDAKAN